jgi:hypothetical protein
MGLLKLGIRPRDIATRDLPECRRRGGGDRQLDQCRLACRRWRMNAASSSTCTTSPASSRDALHRRLKPGGKYVAFDLYNVSGIPGDQVAGCRPAALATC